MKKLFLLMALAACGGGAPSTQDEINTARDSVNRSLGSMTTARDAVQLMSLLPTMPCGLPGLGWLRELIPNLNVKLACADVSLVNDDQGDTLALDFPSACNVNGKQLQGRAAFRYVDQDGIALDLDLSGLNVDGRPIPAHAGYEECKDVDHYYASTAGEIPGDVPVRFLVGLSLMMSDDSGLQFDVDEGFEVGPHFERVTATELQFPPDAVVPSQGSLKVHTWDGHVYEAHFAGDGAGELTIDDHAPTAMHFGQ
jgi:hypothetical protein